MSLKNGKAADEQGITIEHLKYGGQPVIKIIVKLVNFIFQHINLPSNLKKWYMLSSIQKTRANQKSCTLQYGSKTEHLFTLNGQPLQNSVKATHLGIDHDVNSKYGVKDCVPNRIQTARKTVYALMGAGLHGLNGLNPKVSMHLVKIYVLPRLLYGLDSIILSVSDMKLLSVYYTKLLKQIHHLSKHTATYAVYLLLGQIPVEAELHKRMLNFFGNIIRNHGSVERDVAIRQLAVMPRDSNSWFVKIIDLTEQYGLPSPHDLINVPPGKIEWKNIENPTMSGIIEELSLLIQLCIKAILEIKCVSRG
ncbi:unnamed protein product [Mytilus edulis]|uniref:Uncharacterized protein n=1 Tax=Mytilus edulis TaxID=6550 RepID=A0A8S3TRA4_MYTED|nr:unnamed protein product [Mytilus edulis]